MEHDDPFQFLVQREIKRPYCLGRISLKIIFLCDAQLQQLSKLIRKPFLNFLTKLRVNP